MKLRNQDEKEMKVELMLSLFMKNIDDKINQMNKAGKLHVEKFSQFFMILCCEKILDVSQSNFLHSPSSSPDLPPSQQYCPSRPALATMYLYKMHFNTFVKILFLICFRLNITFLRFSSYKLTETR